MDTPTTLVDLIVVILSNLVSFILGRKVRKTAKKG